MFKVKLARYRLDGTFVLLRGLYKTSEPLKQLENIETYIIKKHASL